MESLLCANIIIPIRLVEWRHSMENREENNDDGSVSPQQQQKHAHRMNVVDVDASVYDPVYTAYIVNASMESFRSFQIIISLINSLSL